jgi:hypothetical protein
MRLTSDYLASLELAEWAQRAGFSFNGAEVDGYSSFHDAGWEGRLYIRLISSGADSRDFGNAGSRGAIRIRCC